MSQTNQTTKLNDNEFLFEGEIVAIKDETFSYKGVTSLLVYNLNPELYWKLENAVFDFMLHQEEVMKERKLQADKDKLEEQTKQIAYFKNQVETLDPRLKTLLVKYTEPNINLSGILEKIDFGESISIKRNTQARNSGDWHSYSTNRVWVLTINFKDQRYSNLTKAIDKALEKLEIIKKQKEYKSTKESVIAKFAQDVGLLAAKGWHSSGYNCRGYDTDILKPLTGDDFQIDISANEKEASIIGFKVNVPFLIHGPFGVPIFVAYNINIKLNEATKTIAEAIVIKNYIQEGIREAKIYLQKP